MGVCELAEDKDQWPALLTIEINIDFLRRTQLRQFSYVTVYCSVRK
jgi:hypothetical protein